MKLNHLIIIGALCGALLIPSSASSWGVIGLSGTGAGGGTCSTLVDSQTTYYTGRSWGKLVTPYMAGSFTAGSSYTLCRIDVPMYKGGSGGTPTIANVTAYIYDDDAVNGTPVNLGETGGPLGTSTNTVAYTDIDDYDSYDADDVWYTFNFAGISLIKDTKYWIVLKADVGDDDDYIKWAQANNVVGQEMAYDSNATSWTAYFPEEDYQYMFKAYSE